MSQSGERVSEDIDKSSIATMTTTITQHGSSIQCFVTLVLVTNHNKDDLPRLIEY